MSTSLPAQILESVAARTASSAASVTPVSGGDISAAFRVTLAEGSSLFVKWQRNGPDVLVAEKVGLEALRGANSGLVIPRCLAYDFDVDGDGYLALEWIDAVTADKTFWQSLGNALANLHRTVSDRYGFASDNFIGRLPQSNQWSDSWIEFFLEHRLRPQVETAEDRGYWRQSWRQRFDRLASHLPDILRESPAASLIHGDLWSGNVMSTSRGPAVFDPAVYFGDREVDLAMTKLFGGFPVAFDHAYREQWPLDAGFEERMEIYNLYHLINHLNHFGAGYSGQVDRVLQRFS